MARALQSGALPGTGTAAAAELPWRVISLLNVFRLLLPMLLLLVSFFDASGDRVGEHRPGLFLAGAILYFGAAVFFIRTIARRAPPAEWQALLQLTVDAVLMSVLIHASGGTTSGLATLLMLPTGATATIVRPRIALLGTSIVTLALLVETTLAVLQGFGGTQDFFVTGLTGASLFAITLLALGYARRLSETEALARQRGIDLANLNELNEFIVQHLRESILVVDAADRVRLINEIAARQLRGAPVLPGTPLALISPRLAFLLDGWRRQGASRRDGVGEVVGADGATIIRPLFVELPGTGDGPVLVFLEDTSALAERAQQSRLAALGRLSASIAHEIRNPVGAMSHAGQLLRESPSLGPDDRRLTEIIEQNGARVSRIMDNVLQLSRKESIRQERFALGEWLAAFLDEYEQTRQLGPGALMIEPDENSTPLEVEFDPSHLHQVLWNLCDNALHHGAGSDGAPARIELRTGRIATSGRPFLEVADRGAGIPPDQVERVFEPFFTTGAAGTGLGLFIARELCQTNGALLLYEARTGGGSIFRVIFADPQRWAAR